MSGSPQPAGVRALACLAIFFAAWASGAGLQEPPGMPPPPSPLATPTTAAPTAPPEGAPAITIGTKRRAGVPARSAALLMSGQQGGSIGVSALAVPVAASASGVRLFFVVDIDGSTLLAGAEGRTLPVELSVYAVNPEGRVGGALAETVTLDVERAAEELVGGGIKFFGSLDLAPARYTLRVLVRNIQVGTFGLIEVARAMPVASEPFAFLSPPLVPEPAEAWLLAREAGAEPVPPTVHPFEFLGASAVPATAPVLVTGVASRFWVLGRGVAPATTSYLLRVLNVGGREVARATAALVTRGESPMADTSALLLEATLPTLTPGQYGLEVSAPSINPDILLWSWTRFLAADKKFASRSPVWVQFTASAPSAEGVQPAVAFVGKGGRVKANPKIKGTYRAALRTLAADPASAQAAVAELEAAWLPTGTVAEWETLVLSETEVAQELSAIQREATLGLALFHADLQQEYTRRKSYLLEAHSRRMVETFAVLYAERVADAPARAMAANVLASLAGALQQPGTGGTSERLFRRALELDPANTAALIAMAASMERVGQYERAVSYLKTLLETRPNDAEGRLRLAMNLQRVGSQGKASELLKACANEGNPSWVRVVAYQEMVTMLVEGDRFEQAQQLLREALAIFPGEEGLTMQLTYVLDRQRRPLDSLTLASEVGTGAVTVDLSPRYRYAQPPSEDLAWVRETLTTQSGAAREAVTAALGGTGAKTGGGQP